MVVGARAIAAGGEAASRLRGLVAGSGLRDVAGGFGDAALLIPLAVGLITVNHLNPTVVFAGAGALYVASALVYRLPVPVQPLKAVSAIAISSGLGAPGIAAAGLMIGALFVVLGASGLADRLQRVFANALVRGIQLSIGIFLARIAFSLMLQRGQLGFETGALAHAGLTAGILAGFAVLAVIFAAQARRIPMIPFIVLGAGLAAGLAAGRVTHTAGVGPSAPGLVLPPGAAFLTALWVLVIPQVALSVGNSLMATASAARSYFGDEAARVRSGRLALTMGAADVIVSPLGGMPMCHGAGGLTAHVRMGARTGRATLVYGLALVALGLLAGRSAAGVLTVLPPAILGGMLLYVGIEHAALVGELRERRDFVVAGAVAAIAVAAGDITAGVLGGLVILGVERALRHRERAVPSLLPAPHDG
jgi:hypothetical protein